MLLNYASGQQLIFGEAPTGAINGSNAIFTLLNSPSPPASNAVYKNGVRQKLGSDYFITANMVIFLSPSIPLAGDVLIVDYAIQASQQQNLQYSRTVTVDHTKVRNSDQANFPVLVSGTYPYLATQANGGHVQNPNGYDIIFTSDSAGQQLLNWQMESYNAASGAIAFWVQVPTVSHTTDTLFYMFYGNAAISTFQGNASGTWDSNFNSVYHLANGSTLSVKDSTSNANNGTNVNATFTPGQIDGGANLSGSSQYITMGNVLDIGAGDTTLSAWIKPPNQNQAASFLSKRQNNSPFPQYDFGVGSLNSSGAFVSGKTLFCAFFDGTTLLGGGQFYHTQNAIVDGNWHEATCTRNRGGVAIYVDGVSQTLIADIPNTIEKNTANTASFNIGSINDGATYFTGAINEVRISNIARSADWIRTEYNNQNSPSMFYTIGSETAGAASASSSTGSLTDSIRTALTVRRRPDSCRIEGESEKR